MRSLLSLCLGEIFQPTIIYVLPLLMLSLCSLLEKFLVEIGLSTEEFAKSCSKELQKGENAFVYHSIMAADDFQVGVERKKGREEGGKTEGERKEGAGGGEGGGEEGGGEDRGKREKGGREGDEGGRGEREEGNNGCEHQSFKKMMAKRNYEFQLQAIEQLRNMQFTAGMCEALPEGDLADLPLPPGEGEDDEDEDFDEEMQLREAIRLSKMTFKVPTAAACRLSYPLMLLLVLPLHGPTPGGRPRALRGPPPVRDDFGEAGGWCEGGK